MNSIIEVSPNIIAIIGSDNLSDFRLNQLRQSIPSHEHQDIQCHEIYFCQLKEGSSRAEEDTEQREEEELDFDAVGEGERLVRLPSIIKEERDEEQVLYEPSSAEAERIVNNGSGQHRTEARPVTQSVWDSKRDRDMTPAPSFFMPFEREEATQEATDKANLVAAMQAKYPSAKECKALVKLGLTAADTVRYVAAAHGRCRHFKAMHGCSCLICRGSAWSL